MRLINADHLYDRIMATPTDLHYPSWYGHMVEDEPTIESIKHGHWINYKPNSKYRSICKNVIKQNYNDLLYRYCPNCGAKLVEV